MHAVGLVLYVALLVFLVLLFARWILGLLLVLADVRPTGTAAALAEVAWSTTDVVIRPLDRWLPQVRIGRVVLPLGMIVAWITVGVLMGVVRQL